MLLVLRVRCSLSPWSCLGARGPNPSPSWIHEAHRARHLSRAARHLCRAAHGVVVLMTPAPHHGKYKRLLGAHLFCHATRILGHNVRGILVLMAPTRHHGCDACPFGCDACAVMLLVAHVLLVTCLSPWS